MVHYPAKSVLPEPRKRLVELMQELNYGRIERLPVRGGQPVLDPMPRRVREIKLGGENGARPERDAGDFALKGRVRELFTFFDRLRDGTIDVLVVKGGLPFSLTVTEAAA